MKDLQDFKNSLNQDIVPDQLSVYLQAMWFDGKGDWKRAHDLIDHLTDQTAAHVHAYLHRKEGDLWNADYWYSRAGKKRPDISLEAEWEALVKLYL
jgi:hypothetical protein